MDVFRLLTVLSLPKSSISFPKPLSHYRNRCSFNDNLIERKIGATGIISGFNEILKRNEVTDCGRCRGNERNLSKSSKMLEFQVTVHD